MIIDYISKQINNLDTGTIKATIIAYEISEEDMKALALLQDDTYKINRIFLRKDNVLDLVVDNIDKGYIVQGGLVDDKMILKAFIVKEGLKELLQKMSSHYDFCIYTGYDIDYVKQNDVKGYKFIKCGTFDVSQKRKSDKDDDKIIFTGDTLFCGSVGRTSFKGGSTTDLMATLSKIKKFPDDYVIHTGHGESSTIGYEKRTNIYLR